MHEAPLALVGFVVEVGLPAECANGDVVLAGRAAAFVGEQAGRLAGLARGVEEALEPNAGAGGVTDGVVESVVPPAQVGHGERDVASGSGGLLGVADPLERAVHDAGDAA